MARTFLSHFVLPPGYVQIAFSGGPTSGFMLRAIAEAMLARDHPERHAWRERMEEVAAGPSRSRRGACFSQRYSRRELREVVERQRDWIFDPEDALWQALGGECTE